MALLALWLAAAAGAVAFGGGWPALALALDPAVAGSITDNWAALQLAAAAFIALCLRRCGMAAAVLLVLAAADATDLSARLAHLLGPDPALAKLVAGALLGGAALAPAWLVWRRSCFLQHRLGRRLMLPLLAWGATAVACDALGSGLAGGPRHVLAVVEEAVELLLYATLAMRLLDGVLRGSEESADRPILISSARRLGRA